MIVYFCENFDLVLHTKMNYIPLIILSANKHSTLSALYCLNLTALARKQNKNSFSSLPSHLHAHVKQREEKLIQFHAFINRISENSNSRNRFAFVGSFVRFQIKTLCCLMIVNDVFFSLIFSIQ